MVDLLLAASAMVASVLVAPPLSAVGPLVLLPDSFEARIGDSLHVRLQSTDAASLAWNDHAAAWCFVRVSGSQTNHDAVPGAAGLGKAGAPAVFSLDRPGVTMIGVDFAPATVRLTRPQLDAALASLVTPAERDQVLNAAPADTPVRVRVVRSAKMLVRVLPAKPEAPIPPDAQTTGSKSGQVNEIRVMLDPLESLIGGDINMRFHADFDKAARTRGRATNIDTGKGQDLVSDASGIVLFHLNEPGRWRVDFTAARRPANDATADLILYSASLTYATTRPQVAE